MTTSATSMIDPTKLQPVKTPVRPEGQTVIHAVEDPLSQDVANIIGGLARIITLKSGKTLSAALEEASQKSPLKDQKALMRLMGTMISHDLGSGSGLAQSLSKDIRDALRKVASQLLNADIKIPLSTIANKDKLKEFLGKLNVLPGQQATVTPTPLNLNPTLPDAADAGFVESVKFTGGAKEQLKFLANVVPGLNDLLSAISHELEVTGA